MSTAAPLTQTWGARQNGAPRREATAIRRDELSNRVPRAKQQRAWRKAPKWRAAAAIKRALPGWSGAADNTFASWIFAIDWFQPICAVKYGGWTGSESTRLHHSSTTALNNGSLVSATCCRRSGSEMSCNWRQEGWQSNLCGLANSDIPPFATGIVTGSVACSQATSVSWMFKIVCNSERITSSYPDSSWRVWHGAERNGGYRLALGWRSSFSEEIKYRVHLEEIVCSTNDKVRIVWLKLKVNFEIYIADRKATTCI